MTSVRPILLSMLFVIFVACSKTETAQTSTAAPPDAPAATTATTAPDPVAGTEQAASGPCSYVDAADLTALAGPEATCEDLSEEQARLGKRNLAEYELYVKGNGAREMADAKQFMAATNPLTGLGDEAYTNEPENAIFVRKGDKFLHVGSVGVMPTAPMPYKQGVRFLTDRVVPKL